MTEACDSPAYSELLLNHPCLLGFFLDHCLPRIHVIAIVLTKFSMRLCSWLKASSVRGLNSILPCQIAIINPQSFSQSSFSQIFIFQKTICMSTELVAVHPHRSPTLSGTVHCEVEAWGTSQTRVCRGLQPVSWSAGWLPRSTVNLFDTVPWVCAARFNQCESYGNVPQCSEVPPWWSSLLVLV